MHLPTRTSMRGASRSEDDTTCPASYVCNSEGHCYLECTQTSDCPRASQGYVCKDDEPARGVKFCDAAD